MRWIFTDESRLSNSLLYLDDIFDGHYRIWIACEYVYEFPSTVTSCHCGKDFAVFNLKFQSGVIGEVRRTVSPILTCHVIAATHLGSSTHGHIDVPCLIVK